MNRQEQQRLYLQTIFDYFHEKAEWPTYSYVDKKLFNNDPSLDAKEISASLPDGYANGFRFESDLKSQAMLSLEAIRTCANSEGVLADFITAVRFLVERYKQTEEDNPLVTGADLKNQLHMADEAIACVGRLTASESLLCSSSGCFGQCNLDPLDSPNGTHHSQKDNRKGTHSQLSSQAE